MSPAATHSPLLFWPHRTIGYCGAWRSWRKAADPTIREEGHALCDRWDCDYCGPRKVDRWLADACREVEAATAAGFEVRSLFVPEVAWRAWQRSTTAAGHYFRQVPTLDGRRVLTTAPGGVPVVEVEAAARWVLSGLDPNGGRTARRMRTTFPSWARVHLPGWREVDDEDEPGATPEELPTDLYDDDGPEVVEPVRHDGMVIEPPRPGASRERTVAALTKHGIAWEELANGHIRYRLPSLPPPPDLAADLGLGDGYGPAGWESFPAAWPGR